MKITESHFIVIAIQGYDGLILILGFGPSSAGLGVNDQKFRTEYLTRTVVNILW